jgi:transcriptional regulator with XRE-family HTH domain
MNDMIAKAIIGNMLKVSRMDNGYSQKDIAITLGLPNANYLSMIEKGTNYIPIKRIWDFTSAYRLSKYQGLAALKLTNEDMWDTLIVGMRVCSVTDTDISEVESRVEEVINAEAQKAGVQLLTED